MGIDAFSFASVSQDPRFFIDCSDLYIHMYLYFVLILFDLPVPLHNK